MAIKIHFTNKFPRGFCFNYRWVINRFLSYIIEEDEKKKEEIEGKIERERERQKKKEVGWCKCVTKEEPPVKRLKDNTNDLELVK